MRTARKAKKLSSEMRALIADTVSEILNDPDFGLELSDETKKQIQASRRSKTLIPFSEVKKKYLK